ncbi:MAG: hypothetical protein OXF56_26000 [Rhodobacteraceae bacterium]|nr:hypothetical protein [Paracoccaceae bacterium]
MAPVFQGINPEPPLSITAPNVFAIEGDTVAMPEFHAARFSMRFPMTRQATFKPCRATTTH